MAISPHSQIFLALGDYNFWHKELCDALANYEKSNNWTKSPCATEWPVPLLQKTGQGRGARMLRYAKRTALDLRPHLHVP